MNAYDMAKMLENSEIKYLLKNNDEVNPNANEIVLMSLSLDDNKNLILVTNLFKKVNGEWDITNKDIVKIDDNFEFTATSIGFDYLVNLSRVKISNQNIKQVILDSASFTPVMLTSIEERIENIKNYK